MPKLLCKCGRVIDLSEVPAPSEFSLIPESSIEVAGNQAEQGPLDREQLFKLLDEAARSVVECPECRRLHVQEGPTARTYRSYAPETESSEPSR